MTAPISSKTHYIPKNPCIRQGCASILTPTVRTSSLPAGERTEMIHQYTTMRLVHLSKQNKIKNSLSLKPIHEHLELEALRLKNSGSSNILLSFITFDCSITLSSGEIIRDYSRFHLKLPSVNTMKEAVLSFESVAKEYGGKTNLYKALKHLFTKGRMAANPTNCKHGHVPDYDPKTSKHDQYIRHTEQLLAAYLALPIASKLLVDQLRANIRAKYHLATTLKVYHMGLHMHSTKTCCAPCEYTLLGLMQDNSLFKISNPLQVGFLANFTQEASAPAETLSITLPKKTKFRLIVTVSASETDAHHQLLPAFEKKNIPLKKDVPYFDLHTKSQAATKHIFQSMFNSGYDQRKLIGTPNLSEMTVSISGSRATPGSAGTISKVNKLRQKEIDDLLEQFNEIL